MKKRQIRKITPEKVNDIKELLKCNSIQESARKAQVSFKTVWHVSKGNYDDPTASLPKKQNELAFFNW